ncbi:MULTISPECIES: flagellar basal body P-ring formation chaperone FlgA [unclassified Vibrio]|uniref:flagellar basal body P-ring formation chaperone FlgA n=1 Tax=unclassified Vibrio TaxID=2614977 RepID=UPI0013615ED4|nr:MULTISPECIES: flagellar basal body P-ring formation chaperone FlgA [unclassified Vibrio]NAW57110.1 flagellar basal body P-ring formation protein FlgA [Vibrio sp. V36_P2S2PM302]NAX25077.1 flagellar basal body P-ring formation protein FlgA [Vibrio sp. V38_P2S17PM301]NAX28947.1 flagellar basal body P-ring formation protein FlgA [Vibrio sp. V37_P2S8PM304]
MPFLRQTLRPAPPGACRLIYSNVFLFIGLLSFFFSLSVYAATQEQIVNIQQAAEQHILSTVEWPVGGKLDANASNVDSRIFATDCPAPLRTSASSNNPSASTITVLVECPEDDWRIYVPVRLSLSGPQVTLASALPKGHILSASDLNITMVDLNRFRREGFADTHEVIGAKLKKSMRLGEVLEARDICVVCRNESVLIKAVNKGMTITTKGIALTDGSLGEQIRVKNSKSNRIIDGRVTGIGEVTVQF